jgi:hypothetical protein
MEPKDFTVVRVEGEYAYLRDDVSGEEVFVALALLPPSCDVGMRLHYEMLSYTEI